ncbi:MAG: hypothetical protein F6K19_44455 [Cyanothece sp. SIO1E1]|nr:hypothetical protein [Cyanothece sp. SIO1E1]
MLRDVERGLAVAQSRGLISPSQDLWVRLQNFLALAQNGKPVLAAAEQAGVSMALLSRLGKWGVRAPPAPAHGHRIGL